jgi:hypothetical protein
VSEDLIGYDLLTQEAMRSVVRAALMRAATPAGLPGKHHFYISFRTRAPGVVLPEHLTQRFPEEITIVLEHQFWDLEVFPDRFRVILKFQGQPHPISAPFTAITRFYDPSVRFGLQFEQTAEEMRANLVGVTMAASAPDSASDEEEGEEQGAARAAASGPASVVSLDSFRKKT